MSVEWTTSMHEAWETRNLVEFQRLLDQNYVTRWGRVGTSVPREMLVTSEILDHVKDMARERAKLMGGVIEDIDAYTVSTDLPTGMNIYTWKVRRD